MSPTTNNLSMPLEFVLLPQALQSQRHLKWVNIVFFSILLIPLFCFTLFLSIYIWLSLKQYNLPIEFSDILLIFGLPLIPIATVVGILLFQKQMLKQASPKLNSQHIILSQTRLERVNSKSNEVILLEDIRACGHLECEIENATLKYLG